MHLSAAVEQAWPPFVLVSGLLLIGLVANRDGLFEQTGRFLQGLAGPPVALLAACLLLVAVVTAVLNLDTFPPPSCSRRTQSRTRARCSWG
jgi:arsenical pump membrane protein